jgi:hypothetical protein
MRKLSATLPAIMVSTEFGVARSAGAGRTSATAKEHANITRGVAGTANHSIPALCSAAPNSPDASLLTTRRSKALVPI